MEAKELRVGNLLQPLVYGVPILGEYHSVEPTTFFIINGQIDNKGITFDPIPLTEEILTKCGFSHVNRNGYSYFKRDLFSLGIKIKDSSNDVIVYIDEEEAHYGIETMKAESLHQLQNLVYALTGEELQITL